MKPKALLLTSPSATKNKFWTCSITSPVGSLMPPCDLASIAGRLRQAGIEPRILDLRLCRDPFDALERTVNDWHPNAVVTNMATATAMDDYPMLEAIREKVERRIVFGFHAMALPDEMFQHGATHILVGDPECAAAEAVKDAQDNRNGIWTPGKTSAPPGVFEPLDDLPFPALDLLDLDAYHSLIMGRQRFAILLANRGCPYPCPYCVIPFLFGRKVRTLSAPRIIAEIEHDMREFNIHTFFFIDSAINLKPAWTAEFCEEVLRRNLKIRWCSNMRVPPVTRELLALMKRAGCFRLFYGVEDLDLVDELERKTTREATEEAFALTRSAGIETVAFIILFPGVDHSEKAMARRILNMVARLKADALQCNLAVPYPGSKYFSEYMERYEMLRDWSLYDPAGSRLPYPTELDLVRVRRMVYLRYFLRNPSYLWNIFRQTDARSVFSFVKNSTRVLWRRVKRAPPKALLPVKGA
ncbi:MAG: radical SAM protein [Verrucomicrobia bacterium]|nr:radical SAM protein [Verrucomicrobiota bacterium]